MFFNGFADGPFNLYKYTKIKLKLINMVSFTTVIVGQKQDSFTWILLVVYIYSQNYAIDKCVCVKLHLKFTIQSRILSIFNHLMFHLCVDIKEDVGSYIKYSGCVVKTVLPLI